MLNIVVDSCWRQQQKKKKKKEHKGQMTIYRKSIVCFWRIINNPKCIKEKGVVWIIEIERNIKKNSEHNGNIIQLMTIILHI